MGDANRRRGLGLMPDKTEPRSAQGMAVITDPSINFDGPIGTNLIPGVRLDVGLPFRGDAQIRELGIPGRLGETFFPVVLTISEKSATGYFSPSAKRTWWLGKESDRHFLTDVARRIAKRGDLVQYHSALAAMIALRREAP